MSREPTTVPSRSISDPSARPGNATCEIPVNDERVDDPGEHGQREEDDERGEELAAHHDIPRPLTTTSIALIPMNGIDEPAEAVDEEVAAQHGCRRERAEANAAERERDQRDDDQRVEDDRGEDRGASGERRRAR